MLVFSGMIWSVLPPLISTAYTRVFTSPDLASLLVYKLVNFLIGRKLLASRTNAVRCYTVTEGPTEVLHLRFGAGWAMTLLTATVLSDIIKGKHTKQLLSLSSLMAVYKQNRKKHEKTCLKNVLPTEILRKCFLQKTLQPTNSERKKHKISRKSSKSALAIAR